MYMLDIILQIQEKCGNSNTDAAGLHEEQHAATDRIRVRSTAFCGFYIFAL